MVSTDELTRKLGIATKTLYRWKAKYGGMEASEAKRLKELAAQYPRYGCPMLHSFLRTEGRVCNHKRTYRLYSALGLQVRRRGKGKLQRPRVPLEATSAPGQRWSMDFVSDQLQSGRRFRVLNVIDDHTRECLGQVVDFSIGGERVKRLLAELTQKYGLPQRIVCDNGRKCTCKALFNWVNSKPRRGKVELHFIQPGKPTHNALVESFNGKFRNECLNQHWFISLAEARETIAAWRRHYNCERPHSSLGYQPPEVYRKNFLHARLAGHAEQQHRGEKLRFIQNSWYYEGGKVTATPRATTKPIPGAAAAA